MDGTTHLGAFEARVSELEQLLCGPEAIGALDQLIPRSAGAWTAQFPDLRSLAKPDRPFRSLRVCIATEDVAGPVRNGGIGTTYAALAELLAEVGHDATILYLRGQDVEADTVEHWVNYYAERNVRFTPVPNYAVMDQFRTTSDRWLQAPYNMLRFLLETPQDVVHVSEWRGSGYLSLLAKHQGLAFAKTLFIVKTSSPSMWNRLYNSQPIERLDDLSRVHAERQSVELADMVVGGSLHLLRWMASQGYRIPEGRTFVQPNVASFEKLRPLMSRRDVIPGTRTLVDEIVFFGRLEARKGLFIFCQAIRRLMRMGVPLPPRITFLGKPGVKLAARPDQEILEYIDEETASWPTEVNILSDFDQYEAIEYLLGGARLAVMPSLIENSSMAIYEAAICQVPCVATAVGGNAELIDQADWSHVLCDPNPRSLGEQLKIAIEIGGHVPRPSFLNDDNLETWRSFHRDLGGGLLELLVGEGKAVRQDAPRPSIAVCLYYTGRDDALRATVESLVAQDVNPAEVRIAVDAEQTDAVERAQAIVRELALPAAVIEAFDLDAGGAFNLLAEDVQSDFLLFMWEGSTLRSHAIGALCKVATSSGARVLNYFYRIRPVGSPVKEAPMLRALVFGSTADDFFRNDATQLPLLVERQTFGALGGFTNDYRVLCQDYEFVQKAQLSGVRCETALIELGTVEPWDPEWLSRKGYDLATGHFRAIRSTLAAAPLSLRDLLLASKGLQVRAGAGRGWKRSKEVNGAVERGVERNVGAPKPSLVRPRARENTGTMKLLDEADSPAPKVSGVPTPGRPPSAPWSDLSGRPHVQREGKLLGQLLAVHDERVYGWACDFGALNRVLKVEVELDGRTSLQAADRPLSTLAGLPRDLRRHGFVAQLPTSAWTLGRAASRRLTVRVADSGLVLVNRLELPPRRWDISRSDMEGYCDASDNGVIYGWVWRPGSSDRQVDVAIFIDGGFLVRMKADRYRDDLRHRGVADGEHGFNATLPRAVVAEGVHRIDVVCADTGLSLKRSPLYSEGRAIRIPAKPKKRLYRL